MAGAPIRVIRHETGTISLLMAYDHQPYSTNQRDVPDDIADAQRLGFGLHLPDIDCRQIEWDS